MEGRPSQFYAYVLSAFVLVDHKVNPTDLNTAKNRIFKNRNEAKLQCAETKPGHF